MTDSLKQKSHELELIEKRTKDGMEEQDSDNPKFIWTAYVFDGCFYSGAEPLRMEA